MNRYFFVILLFLIQLHSVSFGQQSSVNGRVWDKSENIPLEGVLVAVASADKSAITDSLGRFSFRLPSGEYELTVRYIGYSPHSVLIQVPLTGDLVVELEQVEIGLGEVEVVSTGYQEIPRSRTSGSFVHLDEQLIQRRVSTNLVDRLEDVTSGLILNRTGDAARDPITIRGRSTLGNQSSPLVVVDNFPYDGNLEDINPNDVASITVLRDAAAASIWGARAGNGVIVVTTKSGKMNQPLRVSITANANWIESYDPFREQTLSVDEFISMEEELFAGGFYNSQERSLSNPVLTPVVETLIQQRDGVISEQESARRIAEFRSYDLRRDLAKYILRPELNRQYSLGLSGGSAAHSYRVGLGLDRMREGEEGNSGQRITLNVRNEFRLLSDRLHVNLGVFTANSSGTDQQTGIADLYFSSSSELYPYAQLADGEGNYLSVPRRFSESFKNQATDSGLLDWTYVPLGERGKMPETSKRDEWRINYGMDYTLSPGWKISALYQLWRQQGFRETVYAEDSYTARELINNFTQVDEASGELSYPIPFGGILDQRLTRGFSHNVRLQMDYDRSWGDWSVDVLGGAELRALETRSASSRFYGYNPSNTTIGQVDYTGLFPQYYNGRVSQRIPNSDGQQLMRDRFRSLYSNASIGYANRYMLTLSARKDASNLFGVKANQRAVPLWSSGLAWHISNEDFYGWEALPYLKFRLSYGYSGNVDRRLTAFTTARISSNSTLTQLPYGQIINPPNENLRWERVKIWNAGVDFESRSGRLSGTVEFYSKEGTDLIGNIPYAPSTGVTTFTGNTASTVSKGTDVTLFSRVVDKKVKWDINMLFSAIREKVTEYGVESLPTNVLLYGNGMLGIYYPVMGRPLFGIYSLSSAGLNGETGAPVGYLDGETSEDYRAIITGATVDNIMYHGPARPTVFGAFRNSFELYGFSISANVSYRFGYYFRRNSVIYDTILQGRGGHSDFSQRWMEPGDEANTSIPSMPESRNALRDQFYMLSSDLIEPGDHIRLQDIRLGYRPQSEKAGLFNNAELYLYLNNVGMIWKATNTSLDPDFGTQKPLRSIAVGFTANF